MNLKNTIFQGHKARKRFGQNFLTSTEVMEAISAAIEPQAQEHIIEIGPGLGAITDLLIDKKSKLTLIELDRDLVARLSTKYAALIPTQVNIITGDILKVDIVQVLKSIPSEQVKIIGNLPYNISTPVLFHLLPFVQHFKSMTFMLQKEVVDRMCAAPSTFPYSALSVILQLECDVENLFEVPPSSFQPPPKVDSAVVQLRPKSTIPLPLSQRAQFRTFVHSCFAQRRKTLRNNLKKLLESAAIEALGIDPQKRPEHLSLENYLSLFRCYTERLPLNEMTAKQEK